MYESRQNDRSIVKSSTLWLWSIIFFFLIFSVIVDFRNTGDIATILTRRSVLSFNKIDEFVPQVDHTPTSEVIIPLEKRKANSEIRYASFGTSHTWGSLLNNREDEAYAWILSDFDHDRGKNYGICASGPSYPSKCISTMMGDEQFDVIVLEFFMRANDGLIPLAVRLRQRFPDAIIVFVRLWSPVQIKNEEGFSVRKWAFDRGFDSNFMHDKMFHEAMLNDGGDDWSLWSGDQGQQEIQEKAVEMVGGYLIHMPFNNWPSGNDGWLNIGDKLLAGDSYHISAEGHAFVAEKVKQIVDRVGVPKKARVIPFEIVDQCFNWLKSGKVEDGLKFSPNGSIVNMPNTDKYGLEFGKHHRGKKDTWIKVVNKANVEMELFIGYMTTGPRPSKYPKVLATVGDFEKGEKAKKVLLKPVASSKFGDSKVHIDRSVRLGVLKPLEKKKIYFKPEEITEWPFRLVQVMITPVMDKQTGLISKTM